jgi:hypothetical protein
MRAGEESEGLQVDDPTRDVQSSKNKVRQRRERREQRHPRQQRVVGNERTSPHAVE